jgi:hypothetical protein
VCRVRSTRMYVLLARAARWAWHFCETHMTFLCVISNQENGHLKES